MECPRCGILASVRAERCPACGLRFSVHEPPVVTVGQPTTVTSVQYAGFWKRFGAFAIDGILFGGLSEAAYQIMKIIQQSAYKSQKVPSDWSIMLSLVISIGFIFYSAIMESLHFQATVGKMLSGLIVTNNQGGRIGLGRALSRNFLKMVLLASVVPSLTFLFIFLPGKKRGLHDMMTGCVVVMKEPKVAPVVPAPQAVQQNQKVTEVTALPFLAENKPPETQKSDENWLYL